MTKFLQMARLALPALFFGYAIFANLALFTGWKPAAALPDSGLLSGGLTRNLDSLYKKDLPHMNLSFGLIGAARYALLKEARQGGLVGQDGWLFSAEEVRPMPSQADLAEVVRTLQEVRTQLATGGSDLVVVPLPAKIDIYRKLSPDAVFGEQLEQLHAAFVADLRVGGVTVVDVRGALLDPSERVFFASDTHWTPFGAQLVAAAVGRSGTIERGTMTFVREEGAAKALTGDLVGFVTTEAFAPAIGLAPETVIPALVTAVNAEADLFGDAASDIVLVGTSYSANTDWGFANALMLALSRDVISVAEQGLGPLKPMQTYLASDDFRDAPPSVVIWEIPIRYLTDPGVWSAVASVPPKVAALPPKENADG